MSSGTLLMTKTDVLKKKKRVPFGRLKQRVLDGDVEANERVRRYVRCRMQKGWRMDTIAKRLRVKVDDVIVWSEATALNGPFDSRPRLIHRDILKASLGSHSTEDRSAEM